MKGNGAPCDIVIVKTKTETSMKNNPNAITIRL